MLVDVSLHEGLAFYKLLIKTSFCVASFINPDSKTDGALLVLYTLHLSGFLLYCLSVSVGGLLELVRKAMLNGWL
jgi:hypothetical protein